MGNMVLFKTNVLGQLTLPKGNLFSSILFIDEKDNSKKCSNPKPLGHKGGF
jgi:hypothetical protein